MKTLNLVGAGRVGRTLAYLWKTQRVLAVQDVCNRTTISAIDAVKFVGTGLAVDRVAEMRAADVWMLTPPDDAIADCCEQLATSGLLRAGDVVFHCSGALSSDMLKPAAAHGALTASVHPLKSFADARDAACSFSGTWCAMEGDAQALTSLQMAFTAIGARTAVIEREGKTIYHAASVMVCNYLVALMEAGLRGYEKSGLPRETAATMMEPLVRETVDNVFRLGTVKALTGPVARGDHGVVAAQLQALSGWNPQVEKIYRVLSAVALELSSAGGKASPDALRRLADLLAADDNSDH